MRARSAALAVFLAGQAACSGACGEHDRAPAPGPSAVPVRPAPPPVVQDPAPAEDASAGARPVAQGRFHSLRLMRGMRPDCVELRAARPGDDPKSAEMREWNQASESLGVAAIGVFHAAFTKAQPGFDLTRARLLSPKELTTLATELGPIASELLAATELSAAKARWGSTALVRELERDDEWQAARPLLVEAARALAMKARSHASANEGVWVLPH